METEKKRQYKNIFEEIGIDKEKIESRLEQIRQTFFYDEKERLYYPAGDDMAYIVDTGNMDVRTEGMSYGMMLCVQLNMKNLTGCGNGQKPLCGCQKDIMKDILPGPAP